MPRLLRLAWLVVVSVLICGALSAIAEDRVPPKVREVMDSAKYKQAHWGLLAVDLKTGDVRYELNSAKLFAPCEHDEMLLGRVHSMLSEPTIALKRRSCAR